jgi:hypothetical protein
MASAGVAEAGARRFALTLGRTAELALLLGHARWCAANGRGERAAAAARRLANHGIDLIVDGDGDPDALMLVKPSASLINR